MEQEEAKLRGPVVGKQTLKSPLRDHADLSPALERLSFEPVRLNGSRDQQINAVLMAHNKNPRYKDIFLLRIDIKKFLREVNEGKQPISRIHALVQDARKYRGVSTEIADIPSVLLEGSDWHV